MNFIKANSNLFDQINDVETDQIKKISDAYNSSKNFFRSELNDPTKTKIYKLKKFVISELVLDSDLKKNIGYIKPNGQIIKNLNVYINGNIGATCCGIIFPTHLILLLKTVMLLLVVI